MKVKLEIGKTAIGDPVLLGKLYTNSSIYSSCVKLKDENNIVTAIEHMVNEMLDALTDKINKQEIQTDEIH